MSVRRGGDRQEALAGAGDTVVVREARDRVESLERRGTGKQKRAHGPRFTVYCDQELVDRIDRLANRMGSRFPNPLKGGKWSRSDIVVPLLNAALDMLERGELNLDPEITPTVSGFSVND
jgi:hypothetical protein